MANSPHPVLFRAMADEFERRGWQLLVTTRDHGQTKDLTLARWPDAVVVGVESPGSRARKAAAIAARVAWLRAAVAERGGADAAASLNSYAQIVAARALRIPAVTLMDYEYQPANHVSFRLATRVVVPSIFPDDRLRAYGARERRVARLDGYKEELYLDREATATARGGAAFADDGRTRVVLRPPAEGALYHPGANADFDRLARQTSAREDLDVIVLPRLASQRDRYAALVGVRVPERTIDGLRLLRSADVFVGGGGTMSREAALLGVRAYTMFAGRRPAVDSALIDAGLLHELRALDAGAVDWSPRSSAAAAADEVRRRRRGTALREWFAGVIASSAR